MMEKIIMVDGYYIIKDNEQFVLVNCYATNDRANNDLLFSNIESWGKNSEQFFIL